MNIYKIIILLIIVTIFGGIVYSIGWTPSGDGNFRGEYGLYNVTEIEIDGNLTVNGTVNITGDVTLDLNWTMTQNYPSACPAGSAITLLNDSVTCTDSWVNIDGDNWTGNMDGGNNNLTNISYLTLNDVLNITPIVTAPANAIEGFIYADTSHALCYYNSTAWEKIGGNGTCS